MLCLSRDILRRGNVGETNWTIEQERHLTLYSPPMLPLKKREREKHNNRKCLRIDHVYSSPFVLSAEWAIRRGKLSDALSYQCRLHPSRSNAQSILPRIRGNLRGRFRDFRRPVCNFYFLPFLLSPRHNSPA